MFNLINSRLAKRYKYDAKSFDGIEQQRFVLNKTEEILQELSKTHLLPQFANEQLAYWLLHESPLTEYEIRMIHAFLFEIDYY